MLMALLSALALWAQLAPSCVAFRVEAPQRVGPALSQAPAPRRTLHIMTCGTKEIFRKKPRWFTSALRLRHSEGYGLRVRNVCENVSWHGFMTKYNVLPKMLEGLLDSDVVMFSDFKDVVFNFERLAVREVLETFDAVRGESPFLAMAEPFCWIGRNCLTEDVKLFYPQHLGDKSLCPHYLNSGLWLATVDGARRFRHMISRDLSGHPLLSYMPNFRDKLLRDDQGLMALAMVLQPGLIKLDTRNELFASVVDARFGPYRHHCPDFESECGRSDDQVWEVKEGVAKRLSSARATQCRLAKRPIALHGNGPSKLRLDPEISEPLLQNWTEMDERA